MQANTLTIILDPNTSESVAYTRHEEQVNRSTYRGPENTLVSRDILQLYRTPQKRAGEYLGAAKTAVKLTRDISVPNASGSGDIVVPLIVECSFSIPVGATPAEVAAIRTCLAALLGDAAVMDDLNNQLSI